MAITQSLFGSSRTIPQTPETGWGAQMSSWASDVTYFLNTLGTLISQQGVVGFTPTTGTLAAAATLTVAGPWHRIAGDGGAVTLNATTSISDGVIDGQLLVLMGTHATNTVTIADNSNVQLKGQITLGLYDHLWLMWDDTVGDWIEVWRNN